MPLACGGAAPDTSPSGPVARPEPPPPPPDPRIDRDQALACLAELPPTTYADALLDQLLPDGSDRPLRLVTRSGEHPTVAALVARGAAFPEEATDPAPLALERVEAARVALRAAPPDGPEFEVAARRLEITTWRLALELARALVDPAEDDPLVARMVTELPRDPDLWIQRLEPDDPEYRPLVASLERFRALAAQEAEQGRAAIGHDRRWLALRRGDRDARVAGLRTRIEQLGFPAPPESHPDRYDPSLEAAIARFEETQVLPVGGRPTEATLAAMDVPLAERVEAIEQALAHIRANPVRRAPDRIQVNIASFGLRLFLSGRVAARHRVIVGDTGADHDPFTNRRGRINQTPTLVSQITDVVLNPSWHVPRRIKELELDPIADRYPGFYDDFELYERRDGVEMAVQLPGPRNTLGRVKFVFPGGGGIFLHDTRKKKLFNRRVRAMSHGCVRVDKALDLARTLLEADRHSVDWDSAGRILGSLREVYVTLNTPLPVSLEYRTVTASADGEVRFHPDVYGWGPSVLAAPHQRVVMP